MGADTGTGSGMQFDKVEAAGAVVPPACAQCGRALDEYFELGGRMFCRACIDVYRGGKGQGSFWRALLFGAGAAVLGTLTWLAVMAILKAELGIIAIAVGFLVGIAVRKGARGLGGGKFQVLAMALTYLSITASYVPFVLKGMVEAADKQAKEEHESADGTTGEATPEQAASVPAAKAPQPRPSGGMVVLALVIVFGYALATPFLLGAGNFMGWIIIGIALYEAWKINRRIPLSGPFRFSGALSVPAPAPVTPGMPPPATT